MVKAQDLVTAKVRLNVGIIIRSHPESREVVTERTGCRVIPYISPTVIDFLQGGWEGLEKFYVVVGFVRERSLQIVSRVRFASSSCFPITFVVLVPIVVSSWHPSLTTLP